jgi:hypothetical protein
MMPITVSTNESLFNILKPSLGQSPSRGVVIPTTTGLSIQVGGQKIPLPSNTGLVSGQPVEVQLQAQGTSERTITIRPLPLPEATVSNQTKPSNSLATLIKEVLPRVLSDSKLTVEQIRTLIPSTIPVTDSTVRILLTLFHQQEPIGSIGALILHLLGKAEEEGVMDSGKLANIRRSLPQAALKNMDDWTQLIKQSIQNVTRSPERLLAQMTMQKGRLDLPHEILASNIRSLLKLPELRQFLETTGEWKIFVQHAHSLLDLLDGIQLANFRGMNYPYLFMEIPIPADTFFQRAQIHVMNYSQDDSNEDDQKVDTVVMDLNTTMLGEMWIRLQRIGDACQCQIHMSEADSIPVVSGAREKLHSALKEHGYAKVSISVEPMGTSRIDKLVQLLGQSAPLDLQV